jgi:CheY-like chemotaxis protein
LPEISTPIGVVNPNSLAPTQPHLTQKTCADITILIVEDNLVNQRVLQKQLLSCGFNVQIANNGQEALVIVEQSQFRRGNEKSGNPLSLILMDIEMPVMNGTDATKKIRFFQAEGLLIGHIPIIAITANARIEQITFARESGMDEVVSKPFRIPELLAKIELFIGSLVRESNSV